MTINTGAVVGVGSNLIGNEVAQGYIPSLQWGNTGDLQTYILDKFLETAALVKNRRGLELSTVETAMLRTIPGIEKKNV